VNEPDLYDMLQGAGDAAFVVDESGSILFWSTCSMQLLGWSPAEAQQKPCAVVLDGCDSTGARLCAQDCGVFESARRNARVGAFDAHVKTASGDRKWVNISTIAARIRSRRVIVHLLRDVDEQKQVQFLAKEIAVLVGRLTGQEPERLVGSVREHAPGAELTRQEHKVLQSLSRGMNTAAIARVLNVTPATVRNHVQHILGKLQVHTRLEAVVRGASRGLL
jgi:PAS domain S-box-containing protein